MRVAMVSEHASPLAVLGGEDAGGQNVHVAELARALARLGAEVTVYTRRDAAGAPARTELAPGVVVELLDAGPPAPIGKDELLPYMGELGARLRSRLLAQRPDVLHAHFWMSGLACLQAREGLPLPLVQTFHALGSVKRRHQGDRDTSPSERLPVERELVRRADRIVATCSDEVFELVRLGARRRRVHVVPCGVDLGQFQPGGPAEPRGGRPRVVVVSRLVERKGIDDVIVALAALPATELVVAGGPAAAELGGDPEARRLGGIARSLAVAGRVELRGRLTRAEVPPLLRSADVVVSAPWYEPFGMVAVEAMACGVPVVATAVGGQVDTVVHGRSGLLVPPRDPPRLAQAVRTLLADPPLRAAMGATAAARARARYGWDRVARQTAELYETLVGEGRSGDHVLGEALT